MVDLIRDAEVDLVVNTPSGRGLRTDGSLIRAAAAQAGILHHDPAGRPRGPPRDRVGAGRSGGPRSLQEYHAAAEATPVQEALMFGHDPAGWRRDARGVRRPIVRRVRAEVLNAKRVARTTRSRSSRPRWSNGSVPGSPSRSRCPRAEPSCCGATSRSTRRRVAGDGRGTLEFVFDPRGRGSWLAEVKAHQFLDVIGPLGTVFAYPAKLRRACSSGGHGAAPMYFLGQEPARGKRVDMLVGAETQEFVFKPIEGKRLAQTIVIATEDGSLGETGGVTDLLGQVVEATGAQVIYAAAAGRRCSGSPSSVPNGRSPRRSPWRRRWRAASACASVARCR